QESNMQHKVTAQIGAKSITIETGKIAKLADRSVVVSCGESIVMASAVSATTIKEGQDYFPLTVDYREKAAAVGKFPGGYFKREGRPSEKETLTSRMTDRPLRPLFPHGYFYDTQVISILLSADGENDPDILSINGASAALCVSDIPFKGPIGAVRIGRVNGEFVANPTYSQKKAFRVSVLEKQKRMDGRGYQDLRQITCDVAVLPRAHGSAIFQRGETQALALATLAPIEEAQMIDAYGGGEQSKRFLLHY